MHHEAVAHSSHDDYHEKQIEARRAERVGAAEE